MYVHRVENSSLKICIFYNNNVTDYTENLSVATWILFHRLRINSIEYIITFPPSFIKKNLYIYILFF